jgi:hypothetical protein
MSFFMTVPLSHPGGLAGALQVLAELAEARASGELGAMSAEDSGARYLARGAVPAAHSDAIVARHKP